MRIPTLFTAAGLAASFLIPVQGEAANQSFDITGTWAAEGKACSVADIFVEFDGRNVVARKGATTTARVANYSTAVEGDRIVVKLTKADTNESDAWSFVVDGSNRIRLDSTFFAAAGEDRGLMKLTRCSQA